MVLVRGKITMAWFYLKRQRKGIEKKRKNEGEREREKKKREREKEKERDFKRLLSRPDGILEWQR